MYLRRYLPMVPSCLVSLASEGEAAVMAVMMGLMLVTKYGLDEKGMELRQRLFFHSSCNVMILLLVLVSE